MSVKKFNQPEEPAMAATITVEEEHGTYQRSPHRHNGYYAGDFSSLDLTVPFRATTYSSVRGESS